MTRKFYDIHCHSMNLSHPNLLAFLKRVNLNLVLWSSTLAGPLINLFGKSRIDKVINLLAVMENDIADFFLLMEYYLKAGGFAKDNSFRIGESVFNKIVLTPLMMDFGSKNTKSGTFYNLPPRKPIVEQVVDVFNGIKKYCENELVVSGKGEIEFRKAAKEDKLFEIYPFLGINTRNYGFNDIKVLLDKYFRDYTGKQSDFFGTMGTFDGDIDRMGSNFFSGIKVYPPLGFDPWPITANGELEKVKFVYKFCCDKNIPITTHCSDGGFTIIDKAQEFTSPLKWARVLDAFPYLKINFAHFGRQDRFLKIFPRQEWEKVIINLVSKHDNVYTDFSYRGCDAAYYDHLKDLTTDNDRLRQRVLFGSDFMINLLDIASYNEYLAKYVDVSSPLSEEDRLIYCSGNPEKFLFR